VRSLDVMPERSVVLADQLLYTAHVVEDLVVVPLALPRLR
jgi:hypothetical protein